MSVSDSDSSTDSDNNNVSPFYNEYLRIPQLRSTVSREVVMSSSNSEDGSNSSSSRSDYYPRRSGPTIRDSESSEGQLCNSSEDVDHISDASSLSPSESLFQLFYDKNNKNNRITPITKSANFLNGLYKREIGDYNNCAMWSNKVYQSVVTVQKLKLSKQLKGHRGCVNSLDFSYSGDLIVSGSDDCRICLWDWSKGKCIANHESQHSGNIFQTKFFMNHGNVYIISSARDGLVALYTLNNTDIRSSLVIARHKRSCNKVCVHRELPYMVLSCGEDGTVKNIDIRVWGGVTNLLTVKNSQEKKLAIYGMDINPMKPYEFIINGDDEYVRMFDKRYITSRSVIKFRRQILNWSVSSGESHITSAVYSYCGTEILASYSEDDIYLFDANDSSKPYLHSYSGHLNRMTVKGVNFYGPKSDYVVSGSDCGHIFIWNKNTEDIVQRKHADIKGVVNVLEAHPYLPILATSGLDHTIKIWEPLNRWHQPNRKLLRMSVVKNLVERKRRAT